MVTSLVVTSLVVIGGAHHGGEQRMQDANKSKHSARIACGHWEIVSTTGSNPHRRPCADDYPV